MMSRTCRYQGLGFKQSQITPSDAKAVSFRDANRVDQSILARAFRGELGVTYQ